MENIVKDDEIREYIENEPETSEGILQGFKDGKSFKHNPFFQKYPQRMRLQVYFDELLVNNFLGTKTYAFQVGAFYFSVLNLPKEINSCLRGIFLFALCYNSDIAAYGINKILDAFMDDLKILESEAGWPVTIKKGESNYILQGTIPNVSADGLAAHEMFGLMSPSENHFCRLCIITRKELHKQPHFLGKPRTKELYNDQMMDLLEGRAEPKDFGIKGCIALHRSKYFHMTDN